MTRVAAVAFTYLALVYPAWSANVPGIYRGSFLYSLCESGNDADRARCAGYVAGAFSTLADPALSKIALCPPDGTDLVQMVLITQKFMREHPEILNSSGSAVVSLALREAFACR